MESSQSSARDQSACDVSAGRRRRQAIYWIATIPHHGWTPWLPPCAAWCKGQLERGEGGFLHWQICFGLHRKASLIQLREYLGPWHFEATRSKAAEDYCWKEATAIPGTRFECGVKPLVRSSSRDWDKIWDCATQGRILDIPADIRIRCYSTLRRIGEVYSQPLPMERSCTVFWGPTGTGKSRRAWEEAGMDSYAKDPRTKWWGGYRGQENIVVDEFRGGIDVAHLLRWLDRYPCFVEVKGGSLPLCAKRFWFTSNLHPRSWYPDLDELTVDALLRRLKIVEFHDFF